MQDKREPGPTGSRPQALLQAYDEWSLIRVGGAGAVLAAGCAGVYAWLGSTPDALLALAAAGGALATVVAWRLSGGRRLVLHLGVGAMTALFGGAAVFGSIAYVAWLGLVSLVAFMLLGQRGGLLWTAAILALVAAAVVHLSAGGDQLSQGSVPVRMLRVIALVPTLAAVASFYERQRRQGLAELERAMAARSRLLAHVSHEMRTPLNGVSA